jgi:hypothetical protein
VRVLLLSLQDAPFSFLRQDDYLVPFQRFASSHRAVQCRVQKRDELISAVDKYRFSNALHFWLCTGLREAIAPIVCVDVFYFSVSVDCVDGRKGWHNKTSQSERLSDQPSGVT